MIVAQSRRTGQSSSHLNWTDWNSVEKKRAKYTVTHLQRQGVTCWEVIHYYTFSYITCFSTILVSVCMGSHFIKSNISGWRLVNYFTCCKIQKSSLTTSLLLSKLFSAEEKTGLLLVLPSCNRDKYLACICSKLQTAFFNIKCKHCGVLNSSFRQTYQDLQGLKQCTCMYKMFIEICNKVTTSRLLLYATVPGLEFFDADELFNLIYANSGCGTWHLDHLSINLWTKDCSLGQQEKNLTEASESATM